MKAKITEGLEKQFEQQSDQKLLNDVTEYLVSKTKFDLPDVFLKKWMQNSGEKPMTVEEAAEEYDRSEKGIRYQLIEGKIIDALRTASFAAKRAASDAVSVAEDRPLVSSSPNTRPRRPGVRERARPMRSISTTSTPIPITMATPR